MIPLELAEKIIRLHFVEKWKVSTIAKQVGVHHSTVRRLLHSKGVPTAAMRKSSMVTPYLPFMLETLQEYSTLPASRLYEMVRERGYPGGPDHFRRIVSGIRPRKSAEAFLKLRTLPAEEGQVDWGHFGSRIIGRASRRVSAFVMVLSWSRMPYVRFYYDQKLGSFLDGHARAFAFFDGVPKRLLYDNLKSVVLERRNDAIRFHPTILSFAAHYRYEPRPVAPYRGNEKGRVERTIRYMRTSFWPAIRWDDLNDLNAQAETWCRKVAGTRKCPEDNSLSVETAWASEQPKLLPLPADGFPLADRVQVRAGKQPYIRFDLNDYSIPHVRVRRPLTVLATPELVRVLDVTDVIAEHARSFDKGAIIEDEKHISALVNAKREARQGRGIDRLHHAVPSSSTFLEGTSKRGHNLGSAVAGLLRLVQYWGSADVEQSVVEAIAADAFHVAAVRQSLERRLHEEGGSPPMPVHLPDDERVRGLTVTPHKLSGYDPKEVRNG